MSKFIVSARKYRPQRFDEVIGQEHVSNTLKNALQTDHLAHAFLFCGPRGVGKTTCARILAKVINCHNVGEDFEPCNTCPSCSAFNSSSSFNIVELDAASNNSVEHMRQLIEQVRFPPQQGKYKVFIIDEVHMLSSQAFNAFLKTLEEPPSYAIFILATTEKHKIIPTILSRCQIFDFKRIGVPKMVEHLAEICRQEGITAETEALHIIAQKADGALRDSLSIFDRIVSFSGKEINYTDVITNLNVLDYDVYFQFVDAMLGQDTAAVLSLFDNVLHNGFEPDLFLIGLGEHLRNLLVAQNPRTIALLELSDSLKKRYVEKARLAPTSFVLTTLQLITECDNQYKLAKNKRLHVELALLKMTFAHQAIATGGIAIQDTATTEKKKLAPDPTPESTATESIPSPEQVSEPEVKLAPQETPPPAAAASPVSKSAPQVTPKVTPSLTPNLGSLISGVKKPLAEQKSTEKKADEIEAIIELDPIQEAWNDFADTRSDMVRGTLRKAQLSLNETELVIEVGSTLAKEKVQQELDLMEFIRDQTGFKQLTRNIEINQTLNDQKEVETRRPLNAKEKFEAMNARNPALSEFVKRFNLKPDEL